MTKKEEFIHLAALSFAHSVFHGTPTLEAQVKKWMQLWVKELDANSRELDEITKAIADETKRMHPDYLEDLLRAIRKE